MWFPAKITSSCIWVAIPVDWFILHCYACGAGGRRSVGRMARYHIFLGMGLQSRARGAPVWIGLKGRCLATAVASIYYLFKKSKTCIRVNWGAKIMVPFCLFRLYWDIETIFCRLLLRIAKIDWEREHRSLSPCFLCRGEGAATRRLRWTWIKTWNNGPNFMLCLQTVPKNYYG